MLDDLGKEGYLCGVQERKGFQKKPYCVDRQLLTKYWYEKEARESEEGKKFIQKFLRDYIVFNPLQCNLSDFPMHSNGKKGKRRERVVGLDFTRSQVATLNERTERYLPLV